MSDDDEDEIDPRYASGYSPERLAERLKRGPIELLPGAYGADVDLFEGLHGLIRALDAGEGVNPDVFVFSSPVRLANYVYRTEVELMRLNEDGLTGPAIAERIAVNGYRLATSEETLAVCAAHPDLQRRFPILALSDAWSFDNDNRRTLLLDANSDGRRTVRLARNDKNRRGWPAGYGFAAARTDAWRLPPRSR